MQFPATIRGVAPTKNRVMRIPDDVWKRAQERAAREGRSITETVTWFLRRYAERLWPQLKGIRCC